MSDHAIQRWVLAGTLASLAGVSAVWPWGSEDSFRFEVEPEPLTANQHFELGTATWRERDYSRAVDHFEAALAASDIRSPLRERSHFAIADCAARLGRLRNLEWEVEYLEASKSRRLDASFYLGLGSRAIDLETAEWILTRGTERYPLAARAFSKMLFNLKNPHLIRTYCGTCLEGILHGYQPGPDAYWRD